MKIISVTVIIIPMNEKFFDLKKEKQDRMINGALKVFAVNGYKHASTDDIVKEAGISKGLLFHYFGSKLGTYAFVYEFVVRFWKMELEMGAPKMAENGFDAFLERESTRVNMLKRYPFFHQFLERSKEETDEEVVNAISSYREELLMVDMVPYAYSVDVKLPNECKQEDLFTIVEMTIQGILREYDKTLILTGSMNYEELLKELTGYVQKIRMLIG